MTAKLDPNPSPAPLPTPPPVPPRTLGDVLKILVAVVVWYAMTGASSLLSTGIEHHDHLSLTVSVIGCVLLLYLLKGLVIGVKAVDFFWAGPSFFGALAPVVSMASRIGSNFVSDFRRAWSSRSDDGSNGVSPAPLPAPPPVDVKTLTDVVKVLVALVVWYLMTGASDILAKIIESHSALPLTASVIGSVMGLYILQGIVVGIKAVDFFWAGPSFFEALAPVMAVVSRIGSNFVSDFKRAWSTHSDDDSTGSNKSGEGAGDGKPGA